MRIKERKTCKNCKKELKGQKIFCSRKCVLEFKKKEPVFCIQCGEKILGYSKKFCSIKCYKLFNKLPIKFIKGLEKSSRNNEIKIRLSQEEKMKINKKADELGLTLSGYLRVIGLYGVQIPNQVLL